MGKGPPFGLELVLANFSFPRLPDGIPKAFKWQKFASKRLPARIWPKRAVSQGSQKAALIARLQATKVPKSGSKRLLARMWPKRAVSQGA